MISLVTMRLLGVWITYPNKSQAETAQPPMPIAKMMMCYSTQVLFSILLHVHEAMLP